MIRLTLALALLASPIAALAADDVVLTSEMFVERTVPDPGGRPKTVVEKPKSVPPGAHLIFVLTYRNTGKVPVKNFTIADPIPKGVAFESADAGSTVSVDGTNFGALTAARVAAPGGGVRPALPEDVKVVRWVLPNAIPVGGSGKVSFRASVK